MKKPIVSISVIVYNSSKYVLDTLESVKVQTYSPLELIVSDDCSTDDTVAKCRDWIEQNRKRFASAKVVVAPKNQGISANYNQGMDNCTGEYIKEIAGDDMLLPNCVEDYVKFVTEHPEAYFCFGKVQVFGNSEEKIHWYRDIVMQDYPFFRLIPKEQLQQLTVFDNPIPSSVFFFSRKRAIEIGLRNDERIPFMEDWPKWINLLKKGEKLWFLDKEVTRYRVSDTQLSTNGAKRWQDQLYLLYVHYKFFPTLRYNWKLGLKRLIRGGLFYIGLLK